jgi:hypothetical protein
MNRAVAALGSVLTDAAVQIDGHVGAAWQPRARPRLPTVAAGGPGSGTSPMPNAVNDVPVPLCDTTTQALGLAAAASAASAGHDSLYTAWLEPSLPHKLQAWDANLPPGSFAQSADDTEAQLARLDHIAARVAAAPEAWAARLAAAQAALRLARAAYSAYCTSMDCVGGLTGGRPDLNAAARSAADAFQAGVEQAVAGTGSQRRELKALLAGLQPDE